MFAMNDDWLYRSVFADERATFDRPHVVLVDDPQVGAIDIHGPFESVIDACREADRIASALADDGDGSYLPPIITVIALTNPGGDAATPDEHVA